MVSAASGAFLVFIAGITWALLSLPPASLVRSALEALADLRRDGAAYLGITPTKHLRPRLLPGDGVVVLDQDRMAPGVTFMTGLFGRTLGFRLYASDGRLIKEWPIDFFKIAPDTMRYPFDALIHGDHLYRNGDVLANLDGKGIVRFTACGQILWQNRDASHHSLFVDEDGFIWTPVLGFGYREPELWPEPFNFDRVARFDPATGRKLAEIDLVEILVRSNLQGLALTSAVEPSDMMHLNDVEVLGPEMAGAFSSLAEGDLLLSSRHFSQLWVLDGTTHALKWWMIGPTIGQHDPDFQPDGTITVFDNGHGERARPRSRIIRIDPATRAVTPLYAPNEAGVFFSAARGKHQVLGNGNILVTETDAGRAFEVTPEGEIVWSFVNGWDENRVAWIMSATRYPAEYAAIEEIDCPGGKGAL
jgi:hypothetical protein